MFYLVLPIAGLAEMAKSMPIGTVILEHLIFGAAVGAGFTPFQREERASKRFQSGERELPSH